MSIGDEFGRRPPRPKNWNELYAITEGLRDIPIEEIVQGHPIHEYEFDSKDMRPCGRKKCERLHAHGWIVGLVGGRYINIGQDCAARYTNGGPDIWGAKVSAYRVREAERIRKEAFVQVRLEAQAKQYWLDNTPEIAQAIAVHKSFCDEAKGPLLTAIERMAEKGKPAIECDFMLSADERAMRLAALQAGRAPGEPAPYVPHAETRVIATLSGLECFRLGGGPEALRNQLQQLVATLLTWQPKDDDQHATRSMQRATRDLAPLCNRLNTSLVAVKRFFSDANMKNLMMLPVVRPQGIISIERSGGGGVRISRRAHWGKAA
ncbi:hypothetical protein [Stenotrophomonas sp. AB1(2024)]|uniref:hypothetical protein n=1 Tax=Stenotrophomonas sp. AB1(2024) TaxID=3132215 RepID=UPI0030A3F804